MNLSEASKKEIDVVLEKCGWRQTKQRVILLKSIFDGNYPTNISTEYLENLEKIRG